MLVYWHEAKRTPTSWKVNSLNLMSRRNVDVVHSKVIEGYEHLDVIWAMDAIEKVGKEVRQVLWKTAPEEARKVCRTPRGCEDLKDFYQRSDKLREDATRAVDVTAGEWSERGAKQVKGSEQIGGGAGKGY